MKIATYARAAGASALATVGAAVALATPAIAAPVDVFDVCAPACSLGWTSGSITWHNRTATIKGSVTDRDGGSTTAVFEAFAGSTKVDSATRTADDASDLGSPRSYNFAIGNPDLVGGIDRVKITVCFNFNTPDQWCGDYENYAKA